MQHSTKWIRLPLGGVAGLLVALCGTLTLAQEQTAAPAKAAPAVTLDSVNSKADTATLAGHNAWMLTSAALVLFMTAPGLAMFYGGLVRKKNVLSVMMQCLYLMALNTVIWGIYGYSLSFGGIDTSISGKASPYIGNSDFLFMRNVERTWDATTNAPVDKLQGAIPRYTHMLFQGGGRPLGLIEGGGIMTGQIVAVVATWVLSIVATFIILMIVDAVIGLRVTPQEETLGLDVSQHEEEGYIFV